MFNDYKRTCYPPITPFPNPSFAGVVPGRFFYAKSETNVNPNAPSVAQQLATNGFRNDNDPAALVCERLDCFGGFAPSQRLPGQS